MADEDRPAPRPRTKKRKRAPRTDAVNEAAAPDAPAAPAATPEAARPAQVTSRYAPAWIAVAALYLATVWLDGVGSNFPAKLAPRAWIYFSQIAALFVTAAPKVIDYRAEGWSCESRTWTEIDVRPYFRIDQDNKENRFQRALQFYRKNRVVMRGLEDYVMRRYNADHDTRIVGVRFSSLRIGYPAPGEHVEPYARKPLATYAGDERRAWYFTPSQRRSAACGVSPGPAEVEPSDRPDVGDGKDREEGP